MMYIIKNTKTIFFLVLMLLFFSFTSVDVFANSYDTPVADANAAMEHAQEIINTLEKKIIDTKKEHQELEMSGIERDVQSAQEQLIESNRLFRLGKYYQAQLAANQAHRLASLGGEELEKYIEDSLGIDQEGEFKSYGSYGDQSFATEEDYIQHVIDQAGKVAFELQDTIIDFSHDSKIRVIANAYDALDEAYQLVDLAEDEYEKGDIDRVYSYTESAIEIAEDALVDVRKALGTYEEDEDVEVADEEVGGAETIVEEIKTKEQNVPKKEIEKESDIWAMPEWEFEFEDEVNVTVDDSDFVKTATTVSDITTIKPKPEVVKKENIQEDVPEEKDSFFRKVMSFFSGLFGGK